ncbi:MAG: hypothetical protein K1X94_33025 [Sandaracinaceae bacterium]|nr:hypothetical protein [Sandaracinaceae bacterium]
MTDTPGARRSMEHDMSSNDTWHEGQYDALAKIGPELRAQLAQWAPKGPSGRLAGVFSRAPELAQLSVVPDCCAPRLA